MYHRGPDDQSTDSFELASGRRVQLLHARLTIIDLNERSNQPFHYSETWLDFNGELYNYLEVRRELERAGLEFTTTSDTEVLAAALDHRGMDALDDCEGMWAFAAFNERSGEVTLARDRFGEKPLFIMRDPDGGLYWGSEAKFIFALAGRTPPVNRRQL